MGLATLLKGPVGPALVAASGVVSWWWGGPTACWRRLRWRVGLLMFLGVTAPWFLAVGMASRGEFFRFAFQTQIVQRIASGMEQHGGIPGVLPAGRPCRCSTPGRPSSRRRWWRPGPGAGFRPRSGSCWAGSSAPGWLLECFQTKLVHYYLPLLPGLRAPGGLAGRSRSRRRAEPPRLAAGDSGSDSWASWASATGGHPGGRRVRLRPPADGALPGDGAGDGGRHGWLGNGWRRGETLKAARGLVGTWAVVMGLFVGLVPAGGRALPVLPGRGRAAGRAFGPDRRPAGDDDLPGTGRDLRPGASRLRRPGL